MYAGEPIRYVSPDDPPRFAIQYVICATEHKLVLTGELDMGSARELGAAVARIRMSRRTALVLDLRRLTFVDSAGMHMIVMARELCAQQQCGFMLVPGQRQVQRAFEICGLLDRLPFQTDEGRVESEMSGATRNRVALDWLAGAHPLLPRERSSGAGSKDRGDS
jgi:anti-anti-sigma factor